MVKPKIMQINMVVLIKDTAIMRLLIGLKSHCSYFIVKTNFAFCLNVLTKASISNVVLHFDEFVSQGIMISGFLMS